MSSDFTNEVKKYVKREIRKWKSINAPEDYFHTIFEPLIRLEQKNLETKILSFVVIYRVRELPFSVFFNHEKQIFTICQCCEELSFLKDSNDFVLTGNKVLSTLLRMVFQAFREKSEIYKPEPKKKFFESQKNQERIYLDYVKAWMKYEPKLPSSITTELIASKRKVLTEIIKFLKEAHSNIHVRVITSFLIQLEFVTEYFKNSFPKIFEDLDSIQQNFIVEIRFPIGFPNERPLIRIVQPKFISNHLTNGGNLLLPELWFSELKKRKYLRSLLEKLIVYLFTNPIQVVTDASYHFYDDVLSHIDFRKSRTYSKLMFGTENNYTSTLKCYSPIFHFHGNMEKTESFEYGNKLILPPSAAHKIFKNNPSVKLPLFFELKSRTSKTYCGVSEFTASGRRVICPLWVMKGLGVIDSQDVKLRCVSLPLCTEIKFQPLDANFFSVVGNYKTLLEHQLKNYLSLTVGEIINIQYGSQTFKVYIMDLKPKDVVSILPSKHGIFDITIKGIYFPRSSLTTFFFFKQKLVVPPMDFKPKIFRKPSGQEGDEEVEEEGEDYYEDLQTPVKITGVKYVRCKNCNHSVNEISYRLHIRHCEKTYYQCLKCNNKIVKISNREKHEKEVHFPVKCNRCGEGVERRFLPQHDQQECKERIVYCKYLGCPVTRKEQREHELRCGSKTEKCQKCQKLITLSDLGTHQVQCILGERRSGGQSPPVPREIDTMTDDEQMRLALEISRQEMLVRVCPFCTYKAANLEECLKHVVKMHFDEPNEVACPMCQKRLEKIGFHIISEHM